jgi:hypothetical protein
LGRVEKPRDRRATEILHNDRHRAHVTKTHRRFVGSRITPCPPASVRPRRFAKETLPIAGSYQVARSKLEAIRQQAVAGRYQVATSSKLVAAAAQWVHSS